jgi:glycosyltransferase involved in cell wall biosynthesis
MDPRIVVVHQENHGQGAARNQSFSMYRIEFVAIMDADDIALPERLEKQINYLRQHESIGMVGTQMAFISSGKRSGFSPFLPCDHQTIYKDLLCGRHAICNPSLMCRTSVLKAIGSY